MNLRKIKKQSKMNYCHELEKKCEGYLEDKARSRRREWKEGRNSPIKLCGGKDGCGWHRKPEDGREMMAPGDGSKAIGQSKSSDETCDGELC